MTSDKTQNTAVIVGIAERGSELEECERSLDELTRLLDTAGGSVCARVIQVKESFDPRTCIGSGKVKEVSELCTSLSANLVVFDFELTPAQIRNLEGDIGGDITVIDRSMLILDIFALHAVSGEGKLQVELAQLRYSAPRLMGKGKDMSRLGGGIGTRGPGETKLESDRRHLKEKVVALERRLEEMEHNRSVMRASRDRSGLPKIAIVGYTNAGKSTLLNALTDAGVLSEDKLFATLDPTTRKLELPSGEHVLLTDTVGFIRKLPHHLVKAFKSTLDEVVFADVLMIVSDATDSELSEHLKVTEEVIEELGASGKPTLFVYNKCDMLDERLELDERDSAVAISARTGEGIERLVALIEAQISKFRKKYKLFIPYAAQSAFSAICNTYSAEDIEYTDAGVSLFAVLDERGRGLYGKYIVQGI
ncbi:MAG: GTPase HflX [Clostridia bacterium]|nr:GTPase HflX [Clostridia bacterium]